MIIQNDGQYTRELKGTISAPDITISRSIDKLSLTVDHRNVLNSDHRPSLITLHTPTPIKIKRWDIRKADWHKFKDESTKIFERQIQHNEMEPEKKAENLAAGLIEAANNTLQEKIICQHSKGWMSPELLQLQKDTKKLTKRYKKRSDTFHHKNMPLRPTETNTTRQRKDMSNNCVKHSW